MTKLLDGKALALQIQAEIAEGAARLKSRGTTPALAVILVGEYPPSLIYVRNKETACERVGIATHTDRLPADTPESDVLALVKKYNDDPSYHGILVQFPVPDHISQDKILVTLDPRKDVDGLNPINFGKLIASRPLFYPCTPAGIVELLVRNGVNTEGAHVVIVGRGTLVGKPLANMLVQKSKQANATVTVCHTRTPDIGHFTRQADILVAAIGSPRVVTRDMVKPGATVIDVGSNRVDNKVVGDVDFESVKEVAGAITPVPGGVGPMTITMLLKNTLTSAERFAGKKGGHGSVTGRAMDIHSVLREKKELVDRALEACLPAAGYAPRLRSAMRYSVFAGGKRLRPALCLLAYEGAGGRDPDWALPTACGLELIHTYSLIHDDLPCMDNDDLRRGKPTAHQAFDEATAILAGDALFALAFELFGRGPAPVERKFRVVREMAAATGPEGIVGGQMVDIRPEKTAGPKVLRLLHRHKTARFIAAALVTGAILAGADGGVLDQVARAGTCLGMMFQITDDILDLTAARNVLGKSARKDLVQDKLTYPRLYGLAGARFRARRYGERARTTLDRLGAGFEPVARVAGYILDRGA